MPWTLGGRPSRVQPAWSSMIMALKGSLMWCRMWSSSSGLKPWGKNWWGMNGRRKRWLLSAMSAQRASTSRRTSRNLGYSTGGSCLREG